MAQLTAAEPEVLVDVQNSVAFVTLNRPKALNSLSTEMVTRLLAFNQEVTRQWQQQQQQQSPPGGSRVACVVVRGAGGKAFCAGGDVKEVVLRARAGEPSFGSTFFRAEYVNNLTISRLPVPYIAVIDGIVMGGGVGVSYHGHFRVATERTVLAMPEAAIGLFPDVGASFFLHRLPGRLGRYMGLTGQRLAGAEVKEAGFATHLVPSSRLPDLEAGLLRLGPRAADLAEVDRLLRSLESPNPGSIPAGSAALLDWKLPLINAHFGFNSVTEVVASLEAAVAVADEEERRAPPPAPAAGGQQVCRRAQARTFLRDTLAAMRRGSPLSHAVTWEMLRRSSAGHLDLEACLEMEFALVGHFLAGDADFMEGVRAVLIDKDNKPRWRFATAEAVPPHLLAAVFERRAGEPPLFADSPASKM